MDKNRRETASASAFPPLQSSILKNCTNFNNIVSTPSPFHWMRWEGGIGILTIFGGGLGVQGF